MNQTDFLKPGLLRLILILAPLLALFSALTLISRHSPPPSKENLLCPFMLVVLPPWENTEKSVPKVKGLPSSPWLQNTHFFRSVLRDFNTGNYPSLELLFYLPLHFTKDNRWLVSTNPFPYKKTSPLIFKEIQERLVPHSPLTLRDLLDLFPNRKWFLHLMTVPPRDSLKNLKTFSEKASALYITSHNEKLLKQLSEEEMTIIYDFKPLLQFQLLGIFLLEKLFSFPGRGLIIPSTLPLSLKAAKKLKHSGQWLFMKKETLATPFPEQKLRQVKGLITREGKQALKWIQDKNPCLQEN